MISNLPHEYIAYAFLGSLIPTCFWLWFWSRRDRFCPEPKFQVFASFIFGALAALFTLPTQTFIASFFGTTSIIAIILFVCAEEWIKYACCWYSSMKNNPYYNERIDSIIYLSTTALGFATLENLLYFLQYLNNFNLDMAVEQGGQRIVGATMLHMVTASIVGIFVALVFHDNRPRVRSLALAFGLSIAIAVHLTFNMLVTLGQTNMVLIAFSVCWILFMITLVVFEYLRSPVCPTDINWDQYDV